jgi:hypothetical protein
MAATPESFVDALNSAFGKQTTQRAAHAKGIVLLGKFVPSAEAASVSKALHFKHEVICIGDLGHARVGREAHRDRPAHHEAAPHPFLLDQMHARSSHARDRDCALHYPVGIGWLAGHATATRPLHQLRQKGRGASAPVIGRLRRRLGADAGQARWRRCRGLTD